jgi:hypothetical protein
MLAGAGFTDIAIEALSAPMYFGGDTEQAFQFVLGLGFPDGLLAGFDAGQRASALAALRADIAAHETPQGVFYASATWLITARSIEHLGQGDCHAHGSC